jgi:hypothetical protein
LSLFVLPFIGKSQIRDWQIRGDSSNNLLYILGTDTVVGSPTENLGFWYDAYDLIQSIVDSVGAGGGVSDHGDLTGLADDDHTQYFLLAGRNSGQTAIGGTAATDDLILRTTAGVGATGADLIFQGGNNGATEFARILNSGDFGIGVSPAVKFHVETTAGNIMRLGYDSDTYFNVSITNQGLVALNINEPAVATESFQVLDRMSVVSGGTTVTGIVGVDVNDYLVHDVPLSGLSVTGGTLTATDGSATNELTTFEEGNAGAITGQITGDFQSMFDIVADGATETNISLDLGEATTVTTPEADDYMIMWEATGEAGEALHQKILYSDIYDLIIADAGADGNGLFDATNDGGTIPNGMNGVLAGSLEFGTTGEADFYIDGTDDMVGIGTDTPEDQLTISNEDSGITAPTLGFHTDQTGSSTAVLGDVNFYYGAEDLVNITASKQTSTGTNDTELTISMEDAGNSLIEAVKYDYEEGYVIDKPRTRTYGGIQNLRVDSLSASTTLDESYHTVFANTSAITIDLIGGTLANNELVGTTFIIHNKSGGNITINPGAATDYINGDSANRTVADNEGWYLVCLSSSATGSNYWFGLKTTP